jgi:succinoglycan biosynthesis transport protein ExoP
VISIATPPVSPSYPKKSLTVFVAVGFGFIIGVGLAILIEVLNAGFTTAEQVESILNLPVLASISAASGDQLTIDGSVLPLHQFIVKKPLSRLSEAIRTLKTGIRMSDVDHPPQIIQFASAVPNEGKTTLATCLAYSVSSAGGRVLLIDADMRNPSLTRNMNSKNQAGLVDYLVESQQLEHIIQKGSVGEPDFIAAGSKTNNPPDLIGSARMHDLLETFRNYYDLIIVDSPPVGPVVDSVILSTIVDKVVVVVRWSATARQMVSQCIGKLSTSKKVAGVIFNLVDEERAEKYGRYAYSYYYRNRYYKNYYVE